MKLDLAFWDEDAAGIRRQARAWAAAEPSIESARIGKPHQPHPDRAYWWEVPIYVKFRPEATQQTLFAEAA